MDLNKKPIRVIPKLDIKGSNVVKGVQMEGLRVVGEPEELAELYGLTAQFISEAARKAIMRKGK